MIRPPGGRAPALRRPGSPAPTERYGAGTSLTVPIPLWTMRGAAPSLRMKEQGEPHGPFDRRRLARARPRHARERGALRAQRIAVPQLGECGRRHRLQGRARTLPSLRLARLPLGAPHAHREGPQGPRGGDLARDRRSADGARGLGLLRGPRSHARPGERQALPPRDLHARQARLQRQGQRAGAVGQEDARDREQRILRDHPHAQQRLRRVGEHRPRPLSYSAPQSHRRDQ